MKNCVKTLLAICIVFCIAFTVVPASAETIAGQVTMFNEIVTDEGMFYAIEQDEKGVELSELQGETVKVSGSVRDDEGDKIIKVNDFSVMAEADETSGEDEETSTNGDNQ